MMILWALVANRSQAKIFSIQIPGFKMKQMHTFDFPKGRRQNREINSDRPGRTQDSFGKGRHSLSKENDPVKQSSKEFAKFLSDTMKAGRTHQAFEKVMIVAPPSFLGELRKTLDKQTQKFVEYEFDLDLLEKPNIDLSHRLRELLEGVDFPLRKVL